MGARAGRWLAVLACGVGCTLAGAPAARAQLEDPAQCTPFAAAEDPQARLDQVRGSLLPLIASLPAAHSLFDQYLTPGTAAPTRQEVTDPLALRQFREAPATRAAQQAVLAQLRAQLATRGAPRLRAPAHPAGGSLARRGLGRDLDIAYPLGFDTPGLIAGGTGGVESPAGAFADSRAIAGRFELRPAATRRGVLRSVRLLLPRTRLVVEDSIDFCPGGLGGSAGITLGTLAMSRLERTPHPAGGTYAKPILFRLATTLAPVAADATRLYRGNDRDGDGIPDRQPWRGAGFALDPCPSKRGPCHRAAAARGPRLSAAFGPISLPWLLRLAMPAPVSPVARGGAR